MANTPYGSVANAVIYLAARGYVLTGDTTAQAADLLIASEWIDGTYRSQFPGYKTGFRAQDREWPRTSAYDTDDQTIGTTEIPLEVLNATYEAMYRENVSAGCLSVDATMGKNIVEAAVSGAVSVKYAGATDIGDLQLMIPVIDKILAPILTGGAGEYSSLSAMSIRS